MKKVLIVIWLSALIISCKKTDTPYTSITGTWELVGQFGIYNSKTFATGQGNLLQFSAGNKYKIFSNNQQVDAGVYRILQKGSTQINKTFDAIYFGEKNFNAISIKGDSLTISTAPNDEKGNQIMDGGSALYVKQK